ncbi:hypothetical protein [Sphaerotilus mobilis]|uniref:Nitrogen fixation protein FixH n=1 Tax=Sphaerotilus mobilis TaxID=47994 RepID=A0A4Q7LBE7_9BURK|nr:hypothetical protein [Sphaerotilus mobilis]RZS46731.1 hypothetical protein EV685_3988 [Sphaerotilus mobilis]
MSILQAATPDVRAQVAVADPAGRVWWREPMMWLVLGGPAAVIVAGFATLAIAIANPDPVLDTRQTGQAADADGASHAGHQPAVQARNHAATGGKPAADK